jgi:hypothetical protein
MSDYSSPASTLIGKPLANSYDTIIEQLGQYYSVFNTGYSETDFMKYDAVVIKILTCGRIITPIIIPIHYHRCRRSFKSLVAMPTLLSVAT